MGRDRASAERLSLVSPGGSGLEDPGRRAIEQQLRHADPKVRTAGLGAIQLSGDARLVDLATSALSDGHHEVRRAGLRAAAALCPERVEALATEALADPASQMVHLALTLLTARLTREECVAAVLGRLPDAHGPAGVVLLDYVRREGPERLPEALAVALGARHASVRGHAAALAAGMPDPDPALVSRALHDPAATVRARAARAVRGPARPALLEDLLGCAHDPRSSIVRCEALVSLRPYDDRRVLGTLVRALRDDEQPVRNVAQELLAGKRGPLPVLRHYPDDGSGQPVWERLGRQVDETFAWGVRTGRELLGRPVEVRATQGDLGHTVRPRPNAPAMIHVNDAPLLSAHRHGVDIVRGLILHELGHHVCDYAARGSGAARGQARSEGVGMIYDILLDERLERNLRSRRPEWGVYFSRLASYGFSQPPYRAPLTEYAELIGRRPDEVREALEKGELPGRLVDRAAASGEELVQLRATDLLAIPRATPPLMAFLWCLRCGFDARRYPSPVVSQALALVPSDLRDLPHHKVLEVARRISGVLGRDHRHRREYEQLRRRVRTLRRIMGGLRRVLERMDETGGLPGAGDAEPGEDGLPPPGPLLLPSLRRRRRHDGKGLLLGVNLGQELEFDPLPYEERLEFDAAGYRSLIADVRGHVRTLRTYLQRLGLTAVDEPAARRGRRLDIAQSRQAAVAPRPDILVFSRDEIHADAYVGVLVDRSASMEGESMARARRFAALLAESARGVRGLEGHVSAFDDDTFYRLGGFQRCAIAALEAGGGNNDAGGLLRAAELALLSRRRHRLLVMISDGMPTECTFDSLQGLVERLTRTYGILCAQVGVARIERVAFPQHVDLSVYPLEEAVARFGRLLISLTRGWR